jgi:hypothetical protein
LGCLERRERDEELELFIKVKEILVHNNIVQLWTKDGRGVSAPVEILIAIVIHVMCDRCGVLWCSDCGSAGCRLFHGVRLRLLGLLILHRWFGCALGIVWWV